MTLDYFTCRLLEWPIIKINREIHVHDFANLKFFFNFFTSFLRFNKVNSKSSKFGLACMSKRCKYESTKRNTEFYDNCRNSPPSPYYNLVKVFDDYY